MEREKRNQKRSRTSMFAIGIVVTLLLATLIFQEHSLRGRLQVYNTEEEELQAQIEQEEARTGEIDELREYMQTDDYAEEVAREKLGLVKEGEIVFEEENTQQ